MVIFPEVRYVDAYYKEGKFYIVTHAESKKVIGIESNQEVSFAIGFEGLTGNGKAKNLGWVLKPENAEIRSELRDVFSDWYDHANDETDENCCIVEITITKGYLFTDHGNTRLEFVR